VKYHATMGEEALCVAMATTSHHANLFVLSTVNILMYPYPLIHQVALVSDQNFTNIPVSMLWGKETDRVQH